MLFTALFKRFWKTTLPPLKVTTCVSGKEVEEVMPFLSNQIPFAKSLRQTGSYRAHGVKGRQTEGKKIRIVDRSHNQKQVQAGKDSVVFIGTTYTVY